VRATTDKRLHALCQIDEGLASDCALPIISWMSSPLFRFSGIAIVGLVILNACARSPERLPKLDRQFYYNLDNEKDQAAFLHLKERERQPYLEKMGMWTKWSELTTEEREAVQTRTIKVGSRVFAAHMAWGPPADVQITRVRNRQVTHEIYIRCTSGPRAGRYVRNNLDCQGTSSEIQLAIENEIVTELKYLD